MVSTLIELMASAFQSVFTVWFCSKFNRRDFFESRIASIFTLMLLAITLFGDYFMPGFNMVPTVLLILTTLFYSLIICDGLYARAILGVCSIHTIIMLSGTLWYTSMSSFINNFDILIQGNKSGLRYVYLVATNLTIFVIARLILTIFAVDGSMDSKTGIVMIFTSTVTLLGLTATLAIAGKEFAVEIKVHIIVLTCVFIAINVILYLLVGQIQRLQKQRMELKLIAEKKSFEEQRVADAQAMLETCRKIKHDMKQHLTVINGYLEDGREDECRKYIAELEPEIDHAGDLIQTGNTILDYLINTKLGTLKDAEIVISGNIGPLSDVSDVDLSCIIGNILDNAVEAVELLKEKRIELTFATQGENRVIICRNTIEESVLKKNKFLTSTKSDGDSHGLGHKIVANVVENYDGMLSYFEEDGMFGVQVILPVKIS